MLEEYITETQDFLNDSGGQFFEIPRLKRYINRARRRIAFASGCIRVMPAGLRTVPRQEIYPFSHWLPAVQREVPQVQSIIACRSLAIAIGPGGWKPMWRRLIWTDFQARMRIFNGTFWGTMSEPGWYAQYGVGPIGKLYLAPIPSMDQPLEVDLSCIPQPLLDDNDEEIIPQPWQDAVCYWAAVLCLLQQQRREDATAMATLFNNDMPFAAAAVCPQLILNPYGAMMRSA